MVNLHTIYYFGVYIFAAIYKFKFMNKKFNLNVNFTLEIELTNGDVQSSTADVTTIRPRFNYIVKRLLDEPALSCGISEIRMLDNRGKTYRTFIINY